MAWQEFVGAVVALLTNDLAAVRAHCRPVISGTDVQCRPETKDGSGPRRYDGFPCAFGRVTAAEAPGCVPPSVAVPPPLCSPRLAELAEQITSELRPLVRQRGHDVSRCTAGSAIGPQRKALESGAELVGACPAGSRTGPGVRDRHPRGVGPDEQADRETAVPVAGPSADTSTDPFQARCRDPCSPS